MSQGISFKTCGGLGANAKLEAFFTSPNTPRTYTIEGGDLTSPIVIESTNDIEIVENLSAGQYIAKMIYQGEELSDPFVITDAVLPEVTFSPATICSGQSSTLTITGTPGAQFLVNKPGGATNIVSIGINGVGTLPGITVGGEYVVTATTSVTGQCYPFTKSVTLNTGGQVLSPTITLAPGSYCVGQPIGFRIEDGGVGAEYIISSSGSGTITTPVVASMTEFNGVFTPNGPGGLIKITGVTDTCNTTTTPQISVTAEPIPTLTGVVATCASDNTHTVSLVTDGTSVTVAGIPATKTSGQNWQRTGITGLTEVEVITVNAAGCENSQTIQLQSCSCPTASLYIGSDGDTCGPGSTNIYYVNIQGQIPSSSWNYVWQKNVNGTWTSLGGPAAWPVTPYTALTALNVVDEYRLMLTNTINGCNYYSDYSISVTASQPPANIVINHPDPIYAGQSIQFTTQQGYESYTWSGGGVTGNTYQSNPITFENPGAISVQVEVCNGLCCETVIKQVIVESLPCLNNTVSITGQLVYTSSCSDITVTASSTFPGGLTYEVTSDAGYVTIPSTPVPGNGTIVIPANTIPAGLTDTIHISVTDSNSCTQTTDIVYSRCECICTNNLVSCASLSIYDNNNITTTKVIGTFAPLSQINWGFSTGQVPDRMKILENDVIILDTGNISTLSGCFAPDWIAAHPSQAFTMGCVDTFLGDEGTLLIPGDPSSWDPNTGISLLVGTADVSDSASQVCSGDNTKPNIVNTSNINGLTCQLGGTLTLSGGELKVIIEPSPCGGPVSWSYAIKCIP